LRVKVIVGVFHDGGRDGAPERAKVNAEIIKGFLRVFKGFRE
jgi:hypothetical protein